MSISRLIIHYTVHWILFLVLELQILANTKARWQWRGIWHGNRLFSFSCSALLLIIFCCSCSSHLFYFSPSSSQYFDLVVCLALVSSSKLVLLFLDALALVVLLVFSRFLWFFLKFLLNYLQLIFFFTFYNFSSSYFICSFLCSISSCSSPLFYILSSSLLFYLIIFCYMYFLCPCSTWHSVSLLYSSLPSFCFCFPSFSSTLFRRLLLYVPFSPFLLVLLFSFYVLLYFLSRLIFLPLHSIFFFIS